MQRKFKISIIIVNYKAKKELFDCVESIYKYSKNQKFEIIVVDNDEKKLIFRDLRKKFPKVLYVPNENLGFGQANNVGATFAKGKYLFFLNPDTKFLNDVLSALTNYLDNNKKVGIVAPVLFNQRGDELRYQGLGKLNPKTALFSMSFIDKLFPNNSISKKFWNKDWDKKSPKEVYEVPGSAFLIRKEIFEKVGKFDENFFLYFEEFDLCLRVSKLKHKIVINPEARVYHAWGSSAKKSKDVIKYYLSSRFYYFKKHFGITQAFLTESFLRFGKFSLILSLILLLGGFLRFYKLGTLMQFIGDQGWFYWSAKQMIIDQQIPLVGIASSHPWIHQGALWTYILAIILSLSKFNPFVPAYLVALIGTLTILLVYIITKKIFSQKSAIISAFIFAASPLVVDNSRLAYHTSLIPTFTLLFMFSTYKWIKGDKRFFPVLLFLSGILYNLEIATFSLIGTFILIFVFGIIKKNNWVKSVLNIKTILLSVLGFIVPMISMIIYDLDHGFPQTLKFIIWIFYKIALLFGFPPIHKNMPGETWQTFANYNLEVLRHMVFIQNGLISFIILILILILFIILNYSNLKKIKTNTQMNVLFIFTILPMLAYLSQKTNSGAYLLMLFPQWIILIGVTIGLIMKNRLRTIFLSLIILFIVFLNTRALLLNNYFVGLNINDKILASEEIIKAANGRPYNILGEGNGSQYESFVTPYEYLTWYLGAGPSEKQEKLKFYISEYPDRINLELRE